MASGKKFEIVIADDEPRIRELLEELFSNQGYVTHVATDGAQALSIIEQFPVDMVISDIQMPLMDGFELFRVLEMRYPKIKNVLMTGYNVDEYISLVRKHNIGNILVKGPDFSLNEVRNYIDALLNGDIFGLNRYFPGKDQKKESVLCYCSARDLCTRITADHFNDPYLEIALDELISNAVFHGVLQLTNTPRELWCHEYVIEPQDSITVSWVKDSEKIGVSIEDPKGRLKKTDVLRWLDHTDTTPRGDQEHGRGFLLVRKLIDRLIINIDPGKRTECIVIQYFDRNHVHGKKPLMIHEL